MNPYPPIGDYALLSDCHSMALVSRSGSIDWCCMPRIDRASIFGRLLDWKGAGFCQIEPTGTYESSREYLDDTLVLETRFRTDTGEATLIDLFAMRSGGRTEPRNEVIRIVEGVRGHVEMTLVIEPRFDYGALVPWLRRHGPNIFSFIGGDDALLISSDVELDDASDDRLTSTFTVGEGERRHLSITSERPENLDPPDAPPTVDELEAHLDETVAWWTTWAARLSARGPDQPGTRRSAIVLKALVNAPTGAIVAAPTTSLPEWIGGTRNWDYRFSWIRDSTFTVRALGALGCEAEADGFRRFVERSAAGRADSLQIMYGVGGERRLAEYTLGHLEGYRGSAPVRVGNGAATQLQLDLYGSVLELSWQWHGRGRSPDDDYWRFLVGVVDAAAERWAEPDSGIWEVRGEPRHFVHSKAMCWVALDRGIRLADDCGRRAPTRRWRTVRRQIREAVETSGYNEEKGTFVRSFGSQDLDASLLLLPIYGFVDFDDDRMIRTLDAVKSELDDDGLLRRYRTDDGLAEPEGTFIACSFWLAECLARQGRLDEARTVFDRSTATANDVGLFSEQFDTASGELLGNFPQGFTHLSHVAAAVAIDQAERPE